MIGALAAVSIILFSGILASTTSQYSELHPAVWWLWGGLTCSVAFVVGFILNAD